MADQQKTPDPPEPSHQPGTSRGEKKVEEEGKQTGRQTTGTTGEAKRPTGKSTAKDSTGINPKDPVDPESPYLPTP